MASVLLLLPLIGSAPALDLDREASETLSDGVVYERHRAASPGTTVHVLRVDLCADGVYLNASKADDSTRSTGSWAADADATAAVNGDFDADACFRAFGDRTWWRSEDKGHDGHLWWTNAWASDAPENWAWWRVELDDAGTYEVRVAAHPEFSVHDDVDYEIRAGGTTHLVSVDPSGEDGWVSLGEFAFEAGGDQWVAVFDAEESSPGSDRHIAVDAVELVRLDLPEEEPEDTGGGEDSGGVDPSGDSGAGADSGMDGSGTDGSGADDVGSTDGAPDGGATGQRVGDEGGCSAAPATAGLWLALLGLARRRRAAP